ncbi:MAG: ribosome biogenesis GTPase Der [Gammaproteobacteria bacterium]
MQPVIALVGRPNVGKSTLFNRLTRSRDALVADVPGLTRDRQYGIGQADGRHFIVIDTGGLSGEEAGIDAAMAEQSRQAIREADVTLFLVDVRAGLTAGDEQIARFLRTEGKETVLVANKVDREDADLLCAEFHALGLGEPRAISASHGRGVADLMERVLERFPQEAAVASESEDEGVRVAVVGRPNVGKSTLVNCLLGEQRVVTFDQPGTTRDAIAIPFERDGKPYVLIDTAGVRRRGRVREAVEKFSIVKTLQAIDRANVVIAVIDAREGVTDQDTSLIGLVLESGRALVVAVNKWDDLEAEQRDRVRQEAERRLRFLEFADIHFISALKGTGIGRLFRSVQTAYRSAMRDFKTPELTRILEEAVAQHPPPLVRGRRIKLRYAHQGGRNPPRIVIHGNQVDLLPESYRRYLANTFRAAFGIRGTPLAVAFKAGENPYKGKKNPLTPRQQRRRQRLLRHVKKKR